MADNLSARRNAALAAVDAELIPGAGAERLDLGTLRRLYPNRAASAGWRLSVEFSDLVRRVDIILDDGFPWTPARVALVDRPPFLTWPHVEEDGVLCFLPSNAAVDSSRPASALKALLGEGCRMVERLIQGELGEDFETEFLSYWGRCSDDRLPPTYSLCATDGDSRMVYCWRGAAFTVIADHLGALQDWLNNRFCKADKSSFPIEPAVLVVLGRPPRPVEYPASGGELLSFLRSAAPTAANMLEDLAAKGLEKLIVGFCVHTSSGPGFACMSVARPQTPRWPGGTGGDPVTKGFRVDCVPSAIRSSRYLGGKTAKRSAQRADASWVHGRDADPWASKLRNQKVTFIGCGSLGAPVAALLARSGLGRMALVDPETLSWANVGRHVLGAADVGQSKASALSRLLRSDLPHMISVEAVPFRLEGVLRERPELLEGSDLVITTTGDWGVENLLNDWHTSTGRPMPIIYGWAEPHACAGHAVAIAADGGCLQCGFDSTGRYLAPISLWPHGETEQREPGCGAIFQPYGPVSMSNIASQVADLAIDCLTGAVQRSTHRVWIGRTDRIAEIGGNLSSSGKILLAGSRGGCALEQDWPGYCADCKKSAAA
jgi:molybdopterin/thiamine biosynthesis adenylyltransferase